MRMPWRPTSLKTQFLVYGAVTVLLAVAITTFLNVRFAESEAQRQVESRMLQTAVALATALERTGPVQAQELLIAFYRAAGADAGYHVVMVDRRGQAIAATHRQDIGKPIAAAMGHPEPEVQRVLAGGYSPAREKVGEKGQPVLDVTLPLHGDPTDPNRVTGALHVAVPYRIPTAQAWRLLRTFVLSLLLLTALLIFPLWLYLKRSVLHPLRIMVTANRAVTEGRPEGRTIPDEAMPAHDLGQVMHSRNQMLARLEAADADLRRRLRELSALNSTAALLSETLTQEEVLERTLDKVLEISGMDAGAISLLEPKVGRLVVQAHRGFSANWLADEASRPTSCVCGQALGQEEPVCLPDIRQNGRVTRPVCVREGFRGLWVVPLRAAGQVLGVMSLHSRQVHRLSCQERDLLAAIGNQVAVALMNVRLYAETQRLATTDPLTGLANRRVLEDHLARELDRARRYGRPVSLIMADLDHFKVYNDTHGHPAGDVILQELAVLLRANVRETDLVARYGGEEFVVLLAEADRASTLAVAEKLRTAVEHHPFPHGETQPGGRLTISLGVATFLGSPSAALRSFDRTQDRLRSGQGSEQALDEPEALIRRADRALYQAKGMGRNRVSSGL